jgi:anthranilate synthase component 1
VVVDLSRNWRPATVPGLPAVFTGGWVGYAGYDTVRYVYGSKIPFAAAPQDDRGLPDMHLSLYNDVVVFDQATKTIYAIAWVHLDGANTTPGAPPSSSSSRSDSHAAASTSNSSNGSSSSSSSTGGRLSKAQLAAAYTSGQQRLSHLVEVLSAPQPCLSVGTVDMELSQLPAPPGTSNMTKQEYLDAVLAAKEYILVGGWVGGWVGGGGGGWVGGGVWGGWGYVFCVLL